MCGRIAGSLGSPLPPRPRIFIRAHAVSLPPPSTSSSDEVSSSHELSASFRVLRPARRPSHLVEPRDPTDQPKSASLGVLFPSSRHQQPASTTPRGFPTQRSRSVLDVSHVLDGFLRHLPSRACFIPLPRPGFALQGFVPRRGAVPGLPGRFMPSCRWTRPPVTSDRALAFRALLPAPSAVSVETGWASTDPRPSWASAPPGSLPMQRGNAFTSPPPSTLAVRNPSRLIPGVLPLHGWACLDSGCRPARAFWPEPPSSFRKSGSRPSFQAAHRAAGHAAT